MKLIELKHNKRTRADMDLFIKTHLKLSNEMLFSFKNNIEMNFIQCF